MKPLTALDSETRSPDVAAENRAQLRALFPELMTEAADGVAVNLDVLKQLVGDETVTDAEEKYGLNWHGKRLDRQLTDGQRGKGSVNIKCGEEHFAELAEHNSPAARFLKATKLDDLLAKY